MHKKSEKERQQQDEVLNNRKFRNILEEDSGKIKIESHNKYVQIESKWNPL